MTAACNAKHIYGPIALLMKELFDSNCLSQSNADRLKAALNEYDRITCSECSKPYCPFLKTDDWIEFMGYTSLADVIYYYEDEGCIGPIKPRKGIDPLKAKWARRPGSYNP